MACQLALADDLSPRRMVRHEVANHKGKPAPRPFGPYLEYGGKPASVVEMPYPVIEESALPPVTGLSFHACGIRKHVWRCSCPTTCRRTFKSPCPDCEQKVRDSYIPGRYARI